MSDEPRTDLQDFDWAIVELMGHRRLAGRTSEHEIAGQKMLRIDVPTSPEAFVTQFYGGGAIFSLTPVSEDAARAVAAYSGGPTPVHRYELPPVRRPVEDVQPIDDGDERWD